MSTTLNEVTSLRLNEFRRRRLTLTASRGWATVIMVFVATLFLAVIVDALTTQSLLRWIASGLVYLATLATWYWSCWRPMRIREPLQSEAMRFEEADPRLREQLLTAVEFADAKDATLQDSEAFKKHLQHQVSDLIAPVNVSHLLPWRMVRRSLFAAASALSILLLLSFIPQLHWINRVSRALFPAANLDRVARVAITIEEPQPNSKNIASGDIIGIVARVDGPMPESVLVESRSVEGSHTAIPMQQLVEASSNEPNQTFFRYQATLSTDQPWIEYRIGAAGASTAWHRLTTQPRPEVLLFTKTLTPPTYSQMSQVSQEDSHGNVRALIGTRVKLALKTNQPVSVAELRWQSASSTEAAKETKSIKLDNDAESGLYVAEFVIERSETYRIHLQSTATGFTNEFSPSYSVEAITDEKPSIVWNRPASPRQIVAPDQILGLKAQIQDEMPVTLLKQLIRINREDPWKETEISPESLKPFDIDVLKSLAGNRESTLADWQVDLLSL